MEHPIQGLMTTAMESLKDMIDVNTIVGDPVETPDGSVILTVSKVGFGFAAGGSEYISSKEETSSYTSGENHPHPFGGGSGGGVSITPIAFLVVNSHGVNMLRLDQSTNLAEKLIDMAPAAIEKIKEMLSGKENTGGIQGSPDEHKEHRTKRDYDI